MKTITTINIFKAVCFCFLSASAGSAANLTFDDLPVTTIQSYGGLQWSGFTTENSANFPLSGYHNGIVSLHNAATDVDGRLAIISSSLAFTFNSAYMTAAWNDGLQVEVEGFVGTTLAYDKTYTVNTTGPTLINFNYVGVDEVKFVPSGGKLHSGYVDHGIDDANFVLDNVTVNAPDTCATVMLLGVAFGGMAIARRKLA